jgi:hypothetical protein
MRKARTVLAAATLALLLALSACGFPQGPAGRVVGKSSQYSPATKTRWYFLTTSSRFRVDISDWDACHIGSAYPKCTEVR